MLDGVIWNKELGICLPFQYHPEDITEIKSLNWNRYPILGIGQPLLAYGGGDARMLRFRILLDAHASPHPLGHVEEDLRIIRTLTVPFDVDKKPTQVVPKGIAITTELVQRIPQEVGWVKAEFMRGRMAPEGPGRPEGVPPVVKIWVGGRILKGVMENLEIQEVLHGTRPEAFPRACTRAWVSFSLIVIEDSRMLVHWKKDQPQGEPPQSQEQAQPDAGEGAPPSEEAGGEGGGEGGEGEGGGFEGGTGGGAGGGGGSEW